MIFIAEKRDDYAVVSGGACLISRKSLCSKAKAVRLETLFLVSR
jgi:hypothetical protein